MISTLIVWIGPILALAYLIGLYRRLPASIPGPWPAKFTDVWRFLTVYHGRPHRVQQSLHERYRSKSDIVRLGPNTVSISGPEYISQIYGIDKKLPKSSFYATFQNIVNGRRAASLVACTDEAQHTRMRRLVAHAYALSTLVEFEPLVDRTTEHFLKVLDQRFTQAGNKGIDFGAYLQYYAFDVMGQLTFGRDLSFLESGQDVGKIIGSITANFRYFSLIGQMPWLDECLGKNKIYVKFFRRPVSSPILQFAQALIEDRIRNRSRTEKGPKDFLDRFLDARDKGVFESDPDAEPMTDRLLLSLLFGNINAGSDTIATTLRALFHYLFTNPDYLQNLLQELSTARESGNCTAPVPKWQETQSEHMPFLQACVKETLRLWPALALSLERVVTDPAGLPITSASHSTIILPRGTIVGINPYVLGRDPRIFDPNFLLDSSSQYSDTENFDPARWLPGDQNSRGNTAAQLKAMENSLLAFGHGKRSCLGKNIALMELYKVVPAILTKFQDQMEIVDPSLWTVKNCWVLAQRGLIVKLKNRSEKDH